MKMVMGVVSAVLGSVVLGGQPPAGNPSLTPPTPTVAPKVPKVLEPKGAHKEPVKPVTLDPSKKLDEAKPGVVYEATSGCTGYTEDGTDRVGLLKYCWSVPEGWEGAGGKPRDVIVVLPGYGMDHTWGHAALPAKDLAPNGFVVCVDGSRETADGGRFPGLEIGDVLLMRDFVLEMTRSFPTAKIILVGHSQGAFAQVMLANRFPRLFNGVVAYGGGVPQMPLMGMRVVPTVFVHGTDDELVPLRVAVDGRDALEQAGAKAVTLRRVVGGGHAPDVREAGRGVTWVRGMVTDKALEAMAAAKAVLRVEGAGEAGGDARPTDGQVGNLPHAEQTPAFGMALSILKRFEADPADKGAWPRAMSDVTEDQKKEAKGLSMAIEAQGLRQVAALRKVLPDAAALRAATFAPDSPTPNWLGHVLSLREDFKGVESVDAYLAELKYGELLEQHEEAGKKIVEALEAPEWGGTGASPKEAFGVVIENLPKAYLEEGLPRILEADMKDWGARAAELRLPREQVDLLPVVSQYFSAVKKGRERYREINREWK